MVFAFLSFFVSSIPPWGHGLCALKKGPGKKSGLLKYEKVQKLPWVHGAPMGAYLS